MIFLFSLGITLILTQSSLFHNFREFFKKIDFLYDLFSCPMCLGFWVGIFVFIFSPEEFNQFKLTEKTEGNIVEMYDFFINYEFSYILYLIYIGSVSSFINWVSHNLLLLLINITEYIKASNIIEQYKKIQEELDEDLPSWDQNKNDAI